MISEFPSMRTVAEDTIRNAWHAPIPVPPSAVASNLDVAWRDACLITTVEEMEAVPVGAIVRSSLGSIACRFDATRGVVFGDDRPFPWQALSRPALLIWSPGWSQ